MKYLPFSWPPHHISELSMSSSKFQINYQMMKRWVRLRRWWGKVIALTAEVDSPCITCSLASGGNVSFIPLLQSNLSCLLSIGHSASKLGLQTWCSVRVVFLMKVWCRSLFVWLQNISWYQLLLIVDYYEETCITWSVSHILGVRSTLGRSMRDSDQSEKIIKLQSHDQEIKAIGNHIFKTNCKSAHKQISERCESCNNLFMVFKAHQPKECQPISQSNSYQGAGQNRFSLMGSNISHVITQSSSKKREDIPDILYSCVT